jgi:hypothetical protein
MTNMNTNYTDARMNLNEVCSWLNVRNYNDVSDAIRDGFTNHTWTKDGMTRVDIIKEIFDRVFGTELMFRELRCDVATILNIVPAYEAHVD